MRREELWEAMSYIDEKYIGEAGEPGMQSHERKSGVIRAFKAAAAVLVLSAVLPNINADLALAMGNMPVLGKYFQVVTIRDYQYDENNKIVDVQVPEVQGPEAAGINREIREYTDQLMEAFQADVKAGEDNYRELDISYEVTMDTEDWFTLRITALEVQAGGAQQVRYYHIDKATGREAKLSDLFDGSQDYISVISENIKEQMRRQMAADEELAYYIAGEGETEDGFDRIEPEQNFYLTKEGDLVIVFDEYQVAPGFMGCPEFVIPKQLIPDRKK